MYFKNETITLEMYTVLQEKAINFYSFSTEMKSVFAMEFENRKKNIPFSMSEQNDTVLAWSCCLYVQAVRHESKKCMCDTSLTKTSKQKQKQQIREHHASDNGKETTVSAVMIMESKREWQ